MQKEREAMVEVKKAADLKKTASADAIDPAGLVSKPPPTATATESSKLIQKEQAMEVCLAPLRLVDVTLTV
jgi:hypothetical protein